MATENSVANFDSMPGQNGGTLRRGNPGNAGGGRHPDKLKRLMRRYLRETAPGLKHIANGVGVRYTEKGELVLFSPTPTEQIAARALMHKIADGSQVPVQDVQRRLEAQFRVVRDLLAPEQADAVCAALVEVWR